MRDFINRHKKRVIAAAAFVLLVALPVSSVVHYTEPTQIGIMWNGATGEIKRDTPGWNISPPWVLVAKVDTRPMRVCISTTGRGFNCKLVQFQPDAFREFVRVEGFRYYWWANRISFNSGYDEEYRGIKDIMRGFAYGAIHYSFAEVKENY